MPHYPPKSPLLTTGRLQPHGKSTFSKSPSSRSAALASSIFASVTSSPGAHPERDLQRQARIRGEPGEDFRVEVHPFCGGTFPRRGESCWREMRCFLDADAGGACDCPNASLDSILPTFFGGESPFRADRSACRCPGQLGTIHGPVILVETPRGERDRLARSNRR